MYALNTKQAADIKIMHIFPFPVDQILIELEINTPRSEV
jgi:hypothetical protein